MVTERTIINALIIGASLILVPFMVVSTLTVNYVPALCFGGLLAIVVAFFFVKEKLCIWPLLGASVAGNLNFLPLPLDASQISCILLILYYMAGHIIVGQKPIKLGQAGFFWPILVLTLILLYHNHSLSVGALGGDTEGAKPALLIYLVVLAYFCGINVETPSAEFLRKVPLYFVILTGLTSIPFLLTTLIPALAPYVYSVTDSVNVDAYVESKTVAGSGAEGIIGRLSVFGPLGGALQLYLLCHYPIGTWLRPERWWVAGLSLVCVILAVSSGYRSVLFSFGVMTFMGTWCYYSWRTLILPAALFIAAFAVLTASSNNLIGLPLNKLPLVTQRSLSFLPGDWDEEAVKSAESSNDFRRDIQAVYIQEYLGKSPWIGNGFDIDRKEFNSLNAALYKSDGGVEERRYLQAKAFIAGKLFHTGWLSVYDIVGIAGSAAFIVLGWNAIGAAAHFVFGPQTDPRSVLFPFYIWILCNIVTMMVAYFSVFGDFKQTFMDLCIYAIVLSQLRDLENRAEIPVAVPVREDPVRFAGLNGTRYARPSRD